VRYRIARTVGYKQLVLNETLAVNLFPNVRTTLAQQSLQQYSPTDYAWRGASNDGITATLVVTENQNVSTSFSIDAYSYSIHPLSNRLHVVVEQDPNTSIQGGKCGTAQVNSEPTTVTSPAVSCEGNVVRVLFMHSRRVAMRSTSEEKLRREILRTFDKLEEIRQNSLIDGRFVLATQNPILVEDLSDDITAGNLGKLRKNNFTTGPFGPVKITDDKMIALKEQYKADIVILLLFPDNSGSSNDGGVDAINVLLQQNAEELSAAWMKYQVIAEEVSGTEQYYPELLAHEIGHLFGGRHEFQVSDANCTDNTLDDNHGSVLQVGSNFNINIMVPKKCKPSYKYIPFWGSPDVLFQGSATGTLPRNSPGLIVRQNFAAIAALKDSYSVEITGPTSLAIGERGTWIIKVRQCAGQEPPQLDIFMSSEQNNKSFDIVSPLTKTSSGYEMRISATMLSNDKYINVYARFASGKAIPFALAFPNYAFLQVKCSDCPAMAANAAIALRAMPKNQQPNAILQQNSPNPVLGSTEIRYSLAEASDVTLIVEDNLGREIVRLVKERQGKGTYTVPFDVHSLPSGIYTYRLQTDAQVLSKQMFIVK
jgi:hypothetical protein